MADGEEATKKQIDLVLRYKLKKRTVGGIITLLKILSEA